MPQNKEVTLTIQARLGSTRLPGKVLKDLAGKPMLAQILNQVQKSKLVTEWTLNTSEDPKDTELVQFAEKLGLPVFRGPVDDMVSRLWGSLKLTKGEYLVRIWGDCPFVCPDIIDEMLSQMMSQNLDFIHNSDFKSRTFPPGLDVEIYKRSLLETMSSEVTETAQREFPVEFVKRNKDRFKMALFQSSSNFSKVHLTVDYPEDLQAADLLLRKLHSESPFFTYSQLIQHLKDPKNIAGFSEQARNIEYQNYLKESEKTKI